MKWAVRIVVVLLAFLSGAFLTYQWMRETITVEYLEVYSTRGRQLPLEAMVGTVFAHVGGDAPSSTEWMPCEGQPILAEDYPELAVALGPGMVSDGKIVLPRYDGMKLLRDEDPGRKPLGGHEWVCLGNSGSLMKMGLNMLLRKYRAPFELEHVPIRWMIRVKR